MLGRRRHRDDQPAAGLDRHRRRAATRAAAWPRGSTTRSARSGSRPASPASGAVFQHQRDQQARRPRRAAATAAKRSPAAHGSSAGALVSGGVGALRRARSPPAAASARPRLPGRLHGRVHDDRWRSPPAIALVGAVAAFALVRSRDFVDLDSRRGDRHTEAASVAVLSAPARLALRARRPALAGLQRLVARTRRAPAGAGSADRPGPRASARHRRSASRACSARSCWWRSVAQSPARRRRRRRSAGLLARAPAPELRRSGGPASCRRLR